ncbi:sensor histidine kinase [Flavobacterium silvaticum]|uniref:histidine kinase n=1 Tax=Flavobacterium silvaticum TaxID=1852020 RepID=A0A972FZ12_9FLAO|nr:HAMP domain-containing sensor histidine kinase [Flavobacterium silvaticum]NMH27426.1 HAMP domain-containing histidine kinase [Flavobacterium silvaticum]
MATFVHMSITGRLSKVKYFRLYAYMAIAIIVAFQAYWLYSVYDSRKTLILEEGQNILRAAVLDHDHQAVTRQLNGLADSNGNVDDVVKQLLTTLKNRKDISIKLQVDGKTAEDSLSRQMLDNLARPKAAAKINPEKEIYKAVSGAMAFKFGRTDYQVVFTHNDKSQAFPDTRNGSFAETQEIRSEVLDAGQYYHLRFYDINSIILRQIWPFLILSVFYLAICIGAVILLTKNVYRARKLMQQKDSFTNSMTHEFKTPMATISAALEALQNFGILDDREMTKEYLGIMGKDLNRLMEMTDSILMNARMSDGKIVLYPITVNLPDFVTGVCDDLKPILSKKSAELSIETDGDTIPVHIDKEHFGNVIRNLVDNAIKYSPEPARISIRIGSEKKSATLLFSDQGMGIPEKYKSEIFKPYFRIQENDTYTVKGFGLGLTYIRQIVLLSGGSISLQNQPAQTGTTFKISIPLHHD